MLEKVIFCRICLDYKTDSNLTPNIVYLIRLDNEQFALRSFEQQHLYYRRHSYLLGIPIRGHKKSFGSRDNFGKIGGCSAGAGSGNKTQA